MIPDELINVEFEQAVLGSIMVNPSIYQEIGLTGEAFWVERNRWIWLTIVKLFHSEHAIDFMTVTEQLDRDGHLQAAGGPSYLVSLITSTVSSLHAPTYAHTLRDLAERRRLLSLANRIASEAADFQKNVHQTQAEYIGELSNGSKRPGGAVHIGLWAEEALISIYDRVGKEPSVLKTNFDDLDRAIGGLDPGEGTMFLLAGEPGAGKTILLGNIIENLQAQAPGALYSMEMKKFRMMLRAYSARTGIGSWNMRNGKVTDSDTPVLAHAMGEYQNMQLYASDSSDWTTATLRADLARLKYEHGIKWYALDYMGLLNDSDGKVEQWERTAVLSRRLLKINRDLGLASIIIHTLTKSGDMSGSKLAQYDMDIGAILEEPIEHTFSSPVFTPRRLRFTKNRDGEMALGDVDLLKYRDRPLFVTPQATHYNLNGNGKSNGKVKV